MTPELAHDLNHAFLRTLEQREIARALRREAEVIISSARKLRVWNDAADLDWVNK